ncbi:MAG TPA: hypothetical protein VFJ43_11710 [Bacteroidia bacterium]|nr:hypothetical protein [Bacteroidia bacterium]
MKKIILYTLTSFLAFSFIPEQSKATGEPIRTEQAIDSVARKTNLENRLAEIRMLDKTTMTHDEKKAVNQEKRLLQKTLHDGYGGIYISVGGLLLIILILILIL